MKMKKKFAFTLAEVLITLTIIGVVAALATPALNGAVQKSKVGPTLRKFISTMENANEHLMVDYDSESLNSLIQDDLSAYYNMLNKYVKGSVSEKGFYDFSTYFYNGKAKRPILALANDKNTVFEFADGSSMAIELLRANGAPFERNGKGSNTGIIGYILYDINGLSAGANRLGKDLFEFILDDNGSIIPWGGKAHYSGYNDVEKEQIWLNGGDECNETKVDDGETCAGSIADNDWKVIYKY